MADGEDALSSLSLEDYLSCLDCPATVLSFHKSPPKDSFTVVFANNALLSLLGLENLPSPSLAFEHYVVKTELGAVSAWLHAISTGKGELSSAESLTMQAPITAKTGTKQPTLCRISWSARAVKGRALVLKGKIEKEVTHQRKQTEKSAKHDWRNISKLVCSLSGGGKMGEMLRNFDWSTNPLGPIDQWPQSLLTATSLCMASSFPMSIWWGPDHVLIYNDAYTAVAGQKHPWLFGKRGAEGWSELWKTLKPLADGVMQGKQCFSEDHQLFMYRNNFAEETYHTWSYIPIRQEDGSVGGLLNPSIEGTARVLYERRVYTLTKMGVGAASARTIPELFTGFADVLATNHCDIPFAMIYILTVKAESRTSGVTAYAGSVADRIKVTELSLQATVNIERGHPAAPETIPVAHRGTSFSTTEGTVWPINEVLHTGEIVVVDNVERLCNDMGFSLPSGGWEEAVRSVAVCPIAATKAEGIVGILVLGLNSRRNFDHGYRIFLELLCRHIATSYIGVKAFEDQVERAKGFAALDSTKTAFFSTVSHELRTPLTLILGPVEDMLRDPTTTSHARESIELVRRNTLRLMRLVNSLLDFSKVEAGRMQASFVLTDIGQFTARLASAFRSAVEKGNLEYIVSCDDTNIQVYVDTEKWEKIVYNLVGNAFKYTKSGRITVRVYPSADEDCVVFEVSDTGIGIPKDELPKIFDRFYRVKNQDGRSYEGSGIGLSICHEFVIMHGGVLAVTSELGKGSTFTVRIPYGKQHLSEDSIVSGNDTPYAAEQSYGMSLLDELARWRTKGSDEDFSNVICANSTSSTSYSLTRKSEDETKMRRIMLVDDNEDMRGYIKRLLCERWVVEEAWNGQVALDAIIANPPDLVISDMMMPVLDGLGLVKALRKEKTTRLVPFILVSAHAGNEASVDGLAAGADDYLVKPFSGRELVARARTHLELGLLRRELDERVKLRTLELEKSESRCRQLAKLMPVGIFRADASGKLTYTNDMYWDMIGGSRVAEAEGVWEPSMLDRVHPKDREKVNETWLTCLRDVKPCELEFQWASNDNVERWCLLQMVTENDDTTQTHCFLGALTDVTDRKTLEKERLEALRVATEQQRIRAEEAEEIKRQLELFVDTICHELRNPLNGIYHNTNLLAEDLSRIQANIGDLKELMSTRTLIPKSDASMPTTDDYTVAGLINWLESQISQSFDALKTIAICGRHQKRIADDVLHMSKLHLNLIVLASVDFDAETEIANVIKIYDAEVRAKGIDVTFICTDNYRRLQLGYVKGDPTRLAQVIVNLLSNAIRFTEKSKVKKIDVTLDATQEDPSTMECYANAFTEVSRSEGGSDVILSSQELPCGMGANVIYLVVTIKDTGCGINQEAQSRLFSRYMQSVGSEFGGHGLGLFISKSLVELQGGKIMLESVKNEGTTFKFYIRTERRERHVAQTEALPAEIGTKLENAHADQRAKELEFLHHGNWYISDKAADMTQKTSKRTVSKKPYSGSPTIGENKTNAICILVVEDNLVNQKVLCRLLQRSGFSTTVANHGAEALDILRESRSFCANRTTGVTALPQFELILMDLEMPVMNGLDATCRIRQYEADGLMKGYIPIMAVSGNARQEYIDKATNAGMDDFLIKPYQEGDLMKKVKILLEKFRLRNISSTVSKQ